MPLIPTHIRDRHGEAVREYRREVANHWRWVMLSVIFAIVGTAQVVATSIALPWWLWFLLSIAALSVAQYKAYFNVRQERDEALQKLVDLPTFPRCAIGVEPRFSIPVPE